MLEALIQKSTNYLISHKVIEEEDREIYEYGFHALFNNIIDVFSIIIISVYFHQVPQTILYHITFVAMRNTAGGFHAKTHFRCFILSTSIWLLSLWGIAYTTQPATSICMSGISVFLVWLNAPIEHENNPLSGKKYNHMKKLCRTISCAFFIIIIITSLLLPNYVWIPASLAYGMISHSLLMILAKFNQMNPK